MGQGIDNILIIEPDEKKAQSIKGLLNDGGYSISVVNSGFLAKKRISFTSYSLILLSRELPDINDSVEFLGYIKQHHPETIVILMFDQFSKEIAIEASRRGAYDFFDNECPLEDLKTIIKKSLERRRLGVKNKQLFIELQQKNLELEWRVKELSALYEISKIIASQPALDEALNGLFSSIQKVMPVDYFLCLSFNQDTQTFHLRFAEGIEEDIIKCLGYKEVKIRSPSDDKMNREALINYYTKMLIKFFKKEGFYQLIEESFLAVPILIEKDLYGLFSVASKEKDIFSDEQRQLLSIIASQALSLYEKASRLTKSTQLITMGQMIAEIAHDLRHPITSIKGALQNLENKWYDDAFRNKSLEVVNNGFFRLNELIKELLEFSNPDGFPQKTVDINQTIHNVLILVKNDLLRHKIKLIQEISALVPIRVNEERIKEVFLNLIVNAIESIGNSGILKISTRLITERNERTLKYVQINFSDTGIGISQANIKKIFDHFFTTKKSGVGLGLAIVNRIIRTHNGFIEVHSEEGKGTTFSIHLPVNTEC